MKLYSFALFALITCAPVAAFADAAFPAPGEESFVRPARVREFAAETSNSLVLREAVTQYRRVTTQGDCGGIAQATRITFQIGSSLNVVDTNAGWTPAPSSALLNKVSAQTPHAALVLINREGRVACPIESVTSIDAATFNDVKSREGGHDNRYSGDRL